jgi:hypothetical protein
MAETEKILQAILDPRWKVGKVAFDGSEHIFVSIQHPQHMTITWLIPREQAAKMGNALVNLSV